MGWFCCFDWLAVWSLKLHEVSKICPGEQDGNAIGPSIRRRLIAPAHFVGRIEDEHRLL